MSPASLSEAQVRHYVAQVRDKFPNARVIGVRTRGAWSGPATLKLRDEELPIIVGRSPLQVREALLGIDQNGGVAVLLTSLDEKDLGGDVIARLARHRLYSIDPWQVVRDLFRARSIDARLGSERALAEALLEVLPQGGPPPVPAGVLDYRTAWIAFLRHGLDFEDDVVDLRALVEWASEPRAASLYASAPEDARSGLREFLEEEAGPAASLVLGGIEKGHAERLVPIALACRSVFAPNADPAAAVRLEQYVGATRIDPSAGLAWAAQAEGLVVRWMAGTDGAAAAKARTTADEFLAKELEAPQLARHSRFLPSSLKQRLADVGQALERARTGGDDAEEALEKAVSVAHTHVDAERREELRGALEMLPRLVRWLRRPASASKSDTLGALARRYVEDGSFVDWARNVTWGGSPGEGLAQPLAALGQDVLARRESENQAFASKLADWSTTPTGDDVLPIERVLDDVVVPIAKERPVLVLVFDGMGLAVFHELLRDIEGHGWIELAPEATKRPLGPAIATAPSVTEYSRASLLAGKLVRGDQNAEKKAFAAHAGLRAQAGSAHEPQLFHKGDIRQPDGTVSSSVLNALQDPKQKVVGVVLNAVDDHLDSGGQIHVRWTCGRIAPLLEILDAADEGKRAIVVVADHGHVVERETTSQRGDGERWRMASSEAGEGEIVLSGPRVPKELGEKIIVPWTERIRYGPKKKAGYHGGATPQEMVVPLAVLSSPAHELSGWTDLPPRLPDWWATDFAPEPEVIPEPARKPPRKTRPPAKQPDKRQEDLFDLPPAKVQPPAEPTPPTTSAWIARLLASDRFADQRERASRQPITDERMTAILHALDRRGGAALGTALAHEIKISESRLRTTITAVRKILNIEGFPVLAVEDDGTVRLNRDLLFTQFEIKSK